MLKRVDYVEDNFKEVDFHNNRFALWIDFRASPDNTLHGDGIEVGRSRDGVRLGVSWTGDVTETVTCFVFVVFDAAAFVSDGIVREHRVQPSS